MHEKTKKTLCDSIYYSIFFTAVVWNWTCNVSEVKWTIFFYTELSLLLVVKWRKPIPWSEIIQFIWGEKIPERNGEQWRWGRSPCPFTWILSFTKPHWKPFSPCFLPTVLFVFSLAFSISWNSLFSTLFWSISSYWEDLLSWSFCST